MLWAVWDHFQGGSLCLTSVCWFFRLTSSVVLWGGGMLQTNSTVVCTVSQPCLTCPFSRRTSRSGSTMLSWEPSGAGPRLCALPRSKPLRFGAQVALRHRFGWDCALCPSQVPAAQEFGERDHCNLSPFLPLLLSFLGGPLVHPMRQMVTVQHPQKS